MNPILKTTIGTLIAAALIGNFAFLWSVNQRLTRIETILSPDPHVQFYKSP
jgi:hypothetical protein